MSVNPVAGASGAWTRDDASEWIAGLHDDVTALFSRLDGGGAIQEDRWDRPGGGGGVSRVLTEGEIFEKAGINHSTVYGVLDRPVLERLGARVPLAGSASFFATGMSLVVHPRSPMVPTVHLNVRYFELSEDNGEVFDCWFGGGTDLTPTYPYPEDAVHFHRTLRGLCDRHDRTYYPEFKGGCDRYFRNLHREGEARGIGGIFFDSLRATQDCPLVALAAFTDDVGRVLEQAYAPIVDRRRAVPWSDRERRLQLFRRSRYAEFNLLHDRGTLFGLQTAARIESVLMSMPPLAAWEYQPVFLPDSFEARLQQMLVPRDWANSGNAT